MFARYVLGKIRLLEAGYKTIDKKLGEKVTTVAVIIQKWKKYKNSIN